MIFVFGSNLDGIHGGGAARFAHLNHGAELGVAEGMTGTSYALPTVGHNFARMPLNDVEGHIATFLAFAEASPAMPFALTPVGCGIAGHRQSDIWSILLRHGVPSNVYLTSSWVQLPSAAMWEGGTNDKPIRRPERQRPGHDPAA